MRGLEGRSRLGRVMAILTSGVVSSCICDAGCRIVLLLVFEVLIVILVVGQLCSLK